MLGKIKEYVIKKLFLKHTNRDRAITGRCCFRGSKKNLRQQGTSKPSILRGATDD